MIRKKRASPQNNHERWLVSYADFITLLFAFFVVLYASSQVDKRKMGQLAAAIQHAFHEMGVLHGDSVSSREVLPPPEGGELSQLAKEEIAEPAMSRPDVSGLKRELEVALAEEIKRQEVAMQIGPEGLIVSLREMGFFDSGSAELRPDAEQAFGRIAGLLLQYGCWVRVEGHTDNLPIHTSQFASNWELSTARSTEVIRKLIVEYGFAPARLSAAGYGEYHPAADNRTPAGRRQNRRIDLVILGPQSTAGTAAMPAQQQATDKVPRAVGR